MRKSLLQLFTIVTLILGAGACTIPTLEADPSTTEEGQPVSAGAVSDEFDDPNLDSQQWSFSTDSQGASFSIANGVLTLEPGQSPGGEASLLSEHQAALTDDVTSFETELKLARSGSAVWGFSNQQTGGDISFSWSGETEELVAIARPSSGVDAYRILVPRIDPRDWHVYRIEVNESTAEFFIDGELVATHQGGIPADDPLRIRITAIASPEEDQSVDVDYVRLGDRSQPLAAVSAAPTAVGWQPYPTATPGFPSEYSFASTDISIYLLSAVPLIDYGHYDEIMEVYAVLDEHVQDWSEVDDQEVQFLLNSICWAGAMDGEAETVIEVCDAAVEIDPTQGAVRDSRGVAQMLIGGEENRGQSISDFRQFVKWSQSSQGADDPVISEDMVDQRQRWIEALENGQNPLDEEELEELRRTEAITFHDVLGNLMPFGLGSGEYTLLLELIPLLHFDHHLEAMDLVPLIERLPKDTELRPILLGLICTDGSMAGAADVVFEACDLAVELPETQQSMRIARGVARAVTEDYDGAIADFEAARSELGEDTEDSITYEIGTEDLDRWIEALSEEEVPFTEEDQQALSLNLFDWLGD